MSNKEENIEFDIGGIVDQKRDEILKSDKFARAEVIIPHRSVSDEPFACVQQQNVSSMETAKLLVALREIIKAIEKKDFMAKMLAKMMSVESEEIEINRNKNKEEE